eukprot:Clim_evm117s109 gene=Clim_evmTU117s109
MDDDLRSFKKRRATRRNVEVAEDRDTDERDELALVHDGIESRLFLHERCPHAREAPRWRPRLMERITWSQSDRSRHCILSQDLLTAHSLHGYASVRSTHGVTNGRWYFELKCSVTDPYRNRDPAQKSHNDPPAWRLGVSTLWGDSLAPVGFDAEGWAWRSKDGCVMHRRKIAYPISDRGKATADQSASFGDGDTIGFFIDFGRKELGNLRSLECPTAELLLHRHGLILQRPSEHGQSREDSYHCVMQLSSTLLKNRPSSSPPTCSTGDGRIGNVYLFRNGDYMGCLPRDMLIPDGVLLFPTASLYGGAQVAANFGPAFDSNPDELIAQITDRSSVGPGSTWQPMADRQYEHCIELCLDDIITLVDGEWV